MKRLLLIAVLCLAAAPVEASTFIVQDGQYEVYGDFGNFGITGSISFGYTGGSVNPGAYDPDYGPYYGYQVTVRANNDGIVQDCSFSQTQSMCGRFLHNHPQFFLSDFDGDGMSLLTISTAVLTTNMTLSPLFIEVDLPPGFILAAGVPEPSTWIMLLIGFALLSMVKGNDRQPLRRVWRLLERLKHVPDVA